MQSTRLPSLVLLFLSSFNLGCAFCCSCDFLDYGDIGATICIPRDVEWSSLCGILLMNQ